MYPSSKKLQWMYQKMRISRFFEDAIKAVYMEGKSPRFNMADGPIPGEMHLSSGQEPCAVGVCAHLEDGDVVTATHRAHHIAIAKGVNLKQMAAEIFGKESGLSGGRGGHMHIFDKRVNFSCSGIIAEGMGAAAGAALAFNLRNENHVAVAYIGEGAANQGAFHEVMNLAAVWKLPFICLIEDNAWGISVSKEQSTAVSQNSDRAKSYNIPGYLVRDNDPVSLFNVAGEAINRARNGDGPSLIEVQTLRMEGHFMGDAEGYRSQEELDALETQDPLKRMRELLAEKKLLSEKEIKKLDGDALALVEEAIRFARESAYPELESALDMVFV